MALLEIIFTQDLFERFLETIMYLQEFNNLVSSNATCNIRYELGLYFLNFRICLCTIPAVCILKK